MMFFRRGRLSARKARAALIELIDQRYQWPLRAPINHLLARGEPLRFLCSLRFLVDGVGQGVHLLNRSQWLEQIPWFGDDLEAAVSDFSVRPTNLAGRLASVMRLDDAASAEVEIRRLLLEIIDLVPKERTRGREGDEQPVVSWLPWVADLEAPAEPRPALAGDPADLRRVAQRAVRIVWRLPGSRLAALTGSVANGTADLTPDIDISLFGLKLPEASVRRSLIAATSGIPDDITQLTQARQAADLFWLNDRSPSERRWLIGVRYFLIEDARRLIERPVPESAADEQLLVHLSAADILVDYELRGPDLVNDLRQATRQARSERVARASDRLDQALAWLKTRGDSPGAFYATVEAILALFQLLAARNDRWIVFPRWTAAWLDGLEHVPADAHQRLSSVALSPFHPENVALKLETMRDLAEEIKAL